MPRFDRSGPMGVGPMTGGGRGLCARPTGAADLALYGRGYGHGRGMGWRRGGGARFGGYGGLPAGGYGYPASKTDEIGMLRANADAMQRSLESIQRRIAELEKEGPE
jgi:hypothetical protein